MPKFRDIPQMPTAHYTVNIGWDYLERWLELQRDKENELPKWSLDLDPEFQRGHVWTEKQKVDYIEYILRGGESGKHVYFNHPNWMGDMTGRMVLVDGKQRINAVLDFLHNKIKAFGYYYNQYEDKLNMISHDFIVNVGCLKTDKEVYEWYLSMNTGGTYHTEEEIEKVKKLIKNLED